MRKFLTWAARIFVLLVIVGGVLYFGFGLRMVMYGGGTPRLQFVRPEAHASAVEEHRKAQTLAPAPPAAPSATSPPAAPATSTPAQTPSPFATALWPEFRGVARDGVFREPIFTSWPDGGLPPLWKQPIGEGYASFAIAEGRAFTIEQRRAQEVVAAYDVATGRELWTHAWPGRFAESMGGDGPRATPTWFDGRVYALGAAGELACLDAASGRQFWRTNILRDADAANLQWGMAASPLIVGDVVVTVPGGPSNASIVAYDRLSGERRWSALDDRQAYTSPMLVTLAGTQQLLVVSATRILGLTADRGRILWSYPWQTMSDINAAQPIMVSESRVYFSSGYSVGGALLEIGKDGEQFTVREVWRTNRMKNRFASAVLHDGFIYGFDESIFACLNAATGELAWKGGRYGYGQVLLAGGHFVVLTEHGDLVLVRPTGERLQELARFSAISGKTWNHPAMANGLLLVRNGNEMAAFDLRPRR